MVPGLGRVFWHSCRVEYQWQVLILIALDFRVLWIYDQQGHLAHVPGDLAKVSMDHITPRDPMTSIVRQDTIFGPLPSTFVSNPACWVARINITLSY